MGLLCFEAKLPRVIYLYYCSSGNMNEVNSMYSGHVGNVRPTFYINIFLKSWTTHQLIERGGSGFTTTIKVGQKSVNFF